ncbi:hypothetical protein L7F22_029944 [Adiantum nelumboides]|nr:hypothetical protein [Adiantum nelumboides]
MQKIPTLVLMQVAILMSKARFAAFAEELCAVWWRKEGREMEIGGEGQIGLSRGDEIRAEQGAMVGDWRGADSLLAGEDGWVRARMRGEGPDHAPRFKATVNFNGEIFESPHFCTTLRQAEHAAAEVALNTLSRRGPSQLLASKILDETSVCKNLLQETAQRVGVSLPVYTTMKLGPGHLPVFKCLVEVAGKVFAGEPAKTKKQAEKNAAMAAWSVIKQWTQPPAITSSEDAVCNDGERSNSSNALALDRREDNSSQMQPA